MYKIGTIGTSIITEEFIQATNIHKKFIINTIYSRSINKAKQLCQKYNVKNSVNKLCELKNNVDVVYIASPNGFHYGMAKYFLENKKHVICEKPITLNVMQLKELIKIANNNKVILFHAYKSMHLPGYKIIKQYLNQIGKVYQFMGSIIKYSSKAKNLLNYINNPDEYLIPNIFNPQLGSGAMVDIGIYPLAFAIHTFGLSLDVNSSASIINEINSDLGGQLLITHNNGITSTITCNKLIHSDIKSEIIGSNGIIKIENIMGINKVWYYDKNSNETMQIYDNKNNKIKLELYYELDFFYNILKNRNFIVMNEMLDIDIDIIKILELYLKNNQLNFLTQELKPSYFE